MVSKQSLEVRRKALWSLKIQVTATTHTIKNSLSKYTCRASGRKSTTLRGRISHQVGREREGEEVWGCIEREKERETERWRER